MKIKSSSLWLAAACLSCFWMAPGFAQDEKPAGKSKKASAPAKDSKSDDEPAGKSKTGKPEKGSASKDDSSEEGFGSSRSKEDKKSTSSSTSSKKGKLSKEERDAKRARDLVLKALGGKKDDLFIIEYVTIIYEEPTGLDVARSKAAGKNRSLYDTTEDRKVELHMARDEAADKILEHVGMEKVLNNKKPAAKSKDSDGPPPPAKDFLLVGRFDKSQETLARSQKMEREHKLNAAKQDKEKDTKKKKA